MRPIVFIAIIVVVVVIGFFAWQVFAPPHIS